MTSLWDWVVDRSENHPAAFRRIFPLFLIMLIAYVALGWVGSNLAEQGRGLCEQNNTARVGALKEQTGLRAVAERKALNAELKGQLPIVKIFEDEAAIHQDRIDNLQEVAAQSGHASSRNSVTIQCADDWPKPIPWFEGGGD